MLSNFLCLLCCCYRRATQSLCTFASKWLAYSKECPGIVTVDPPHPIAVTKFSSTSSTPVSFRFIEISTSSIQKFNFN